MLRNLDILSRARAAGIHLLISGILAGLSAILVFGIWYPGIYKTLAGGRDLFLLIVSVDVVLGPLLTFAVFNLKKGLPHLRRDLIIIASIQLIALLYGVNTVYEVRPIATIFEVDRFRIITAVQVNKSELSKARLEYQELPLWGPWLLGTREPEGSSEHNEALFMALEKGIDRAERPLFWQPYADSLSEILARARPVSLLLSTYPHIADDVRKNLKIKNLSEENAKFIPIMSRGGDWVVIIDQQGRLIHYVQVDGFF